MLIRGWRELWSLRGERSRINVRAWLTASHKHRASNERLLDPLTSPIIMGWMKGSLRPPKDDRRGVKVVSLVKTSSGRDG